MASYNRHTPGALVAVIAICFASCSPAQRTTGQQEDRVAEIRVMAYNIHHSNPPAKPDVIDIDGIAQAIRKQDPDLVALQEVDVNTRRSGAFNQAEEIAKRLDMKYFFGKAIDYQGGEYGVAILSKFPMDQNQVHRLPSREGTGGEPRIMATARIRLPNGSFIRFGSTHLDNQREPANRELQIEEIIRIAREEELPFILGGDFNAVPDSEVMRRTEGVFRKSCEDCPFTSSAQNPVRTIDYILFRDPDNKLSVGDHRVPDENKASDHLPVVADFKVSP